MTINKFSKNIILLGLSIIVILPAITNNGFTNEKTAKVVFAVT